MAPSIPTDLLKAVQNIVSQMDADVFVYNGPIEPARDLQFIQLVAENKHRDSALLLLTTNGGAPDAAYKITRYFQERYEHFTVLVGGHCKSAGTLIAIGATDLAFMPYGELGPLDVQLTKVDKFDQAQSGLTIQDALDLLEGRARTAFYRIVNEYIEANQGLLSFASASKAASDFVTQLYAPVLSRIDPEEVGARARSMQIADAYGKRLAVRWGNVKEDAVRRLAVTYPSHTFVIDAREAATLFQRVRLATDGERALVEALGDYARYQSPGTGCAMHALSGPADNIGENDATELEDRGEPQDSGDTSRTSGAAQLPPDSAAISDRLAARPRRGGNGSG